MCLLHGSFSQIDILGLKQFAFTENGSPFTSIDGYAIM